jgi:tetratricopeptide (TPR) repeat protein
LDQLLPSHPTNADLLTSRALLLGLMGRHGESVADAKLAVTANPDDSLAVQILVESLAEQGADTEAAAILEQWLIENWQRRRTRATLASYYLLIDPIAAADSLNRLLRLVPEPEALTLVAAEVNLSAGRFADAALLYQDLLDEPDHLEIARMQLGLIADHRGRPDEAYDHYRQIELGAYYQEAQERIVELLLRTQRGDLLLEHFAHERARNPHIAETLFSLQYAYVADLDYLFDDLAQLDFLNQALDHFPLNMQLLYARALVAERLDDIEQLERDLRLMLSQDPNSSAALNALGYTLANRTDRYTEAHPLISRALEIEPDSPAIQDSMGWVLYKMGQLEEALFWLALAQEGYYDPEVISHHAEVLWALGRVDEALDLIDTALLDFPGDPSLGDIRRRILRSLGNG